MPLYKLRHFQCIGCKKQISKRTPARCTRYCSLECYRTSEHPARKTGKEVKCIQCDKLIYKQLSLLSKNPSCSVECTIEWQRRTKITRTCRVCGDVFKLSPSRLKQIAGYYCSIKCRTACERWHRHAVVAGNKIQNKKKGLNRLELVGKTILRSIGVKFRTEFLMFNKFLVDAYLIDLKIVIQWDGEYWHGHPSKLKNGVPDERQAKRMRLDRSQDAYFKKAGIKVLRFWESDVYKRREAIIEIIRRTVQASA